MRLAPVTFRPSIRLAAVTLPEALQVFGSLSATDNGSGAATITFTLPLGEALSASESGPGTATITFEAT